MKRINRIILAIIVIIFAAALLRTAEQIIESRIYKNLSIDQITEKRYGDSDTKYIESNGYYFLISGTKDEIIYFENESKRVFFSSGIYPKEGQVRRIFVDIPGFSGNINIYQEENFYLLCISEPFPKESVSISDSSEAWESIYSKKLDKNYYFKELKKN